MWGEQSCLLGGRIPYFLRFSSSALHILWLAASYRSELVQQRLVERIVRMRRAVQRVLRERYFSSLIAGGHTQRHLVSSPSFHVSVAKVLFWPLVASLCRG
eukprot:s663_g9.t1